MMVSKGGIPCWEPEEQFQWIQLKKRTEKMDLKRAINRLETVARRSSWQDTEQARAIATVIEAAKKQLPPEPRDHLHLYLYKGKWEINHRGNGQLQTEKTAQEWHGFKVRPNGTSLVVKVPV